MNGQLKINMTHVATHLEASAMMTFCFLYHLVIHLVIYTRLVPTRPNTVLITTVNPNPSNARDPRFRCLVKLCDSC